MLYRAGGTVVLCTASVDQACPPWMEGKGKGWVTAEYQMHPRANRARREARDGRGKAPSGRTQEIQRLIGRALRAAVDLDELGERTIAIDCDVLEADGGTRTASITGGFVALALALAKLRTAATIAPVLREQVAAISVGSRRRRARCSTSSTRRTARRASTSTSSRTARGAIVEVQGDRRGRGDPAAWTSTA